MIGEIQRAAGRRGAGDDAVRRQPDRRHAGGRSAAANLLGAERWRTQCDLAVDSWTERCWSATGSSRTSSRREARPLAVACREMSDRFLRGGRLLAFGRGPYATDAQHVSVEFVHPGDCRQARAARARSLASVPAVARRYSAARGYRDGIRSSRRRSGGRTALCMPRTPRGAMTFALPGTGGLLSSFAASTARSVHASGNDRNSVPHAVGDGARLLRASRTGARRRAGRRSSIRFSDRRSRAPAMSWTKVAASIRMKVAGRRAVARAGCAGGIGANRQCRARPSHERVRRGGKLIIFGNGGSATDANDWAIDCVLRPRGYRPIPAISLVARAGQYHRDRQRRRHRADFSAPADRAGAAGGCGRSESPPAAARATSSWRWKKRAKRGMLTVALLGYDGGEILRRGLADFPMVVRSDYIPRIQEVQASIYHVIRETLEVLARA